MSSPFGRACDPTVGVLGRGIHLRCTCTVQYRQCRYRWREVGRIELMVVLDFLDT